MIQMLVRQVAAAVVALVLVAGPARAADPIPPERQKLIVEMVEAAGMMRMIDNMLPAVMAEFERAFRAKSHKGQNDEDAIASIRKFVQEEISIVMRETMANITPLFAEFFSGDDLHQLIQFHKSPIGQKSQAVMPQLFAKMIPIIQRMQGNLVERVRRRVELLAPPPAKGKEG